MPSPPISPSPRRRIPIVIASAVLQPLVSQWRAGAPLIAEAGITATLAAGFSSALFLNVPPWVVLAVVLAGIALRRAELDSWALFIPGGLFGRAQAAFGRGPARVAAATSLIERILFVSLVALIGGHYAVSFLVALLRVARPYRAFAFEDLHTVVAAGLVGVIWLRARLGWMTNARIRGHLVWAATAVVAALAVWASIHLASSMSSARLVDVMLPGMSSGPILSRVAWPWLNVTLACLIGFGVSMPALGTAESLGRVATELPQPRIVALRRLLVVVAVLALGITAMSAWVAAVEFSPLGRVGWMDTPLLAITRALGGPGWLVNAATFAVAGAAVAILIYAMDSGLDDAERTLRGLADRGVLPERIVAVHPRFGTFVHLSNIAAAGIVVAILLGSGHLQWLTSAYATALGATQIFKVVVLRRVQRRQQVESVARTTPTLWIIVGLIAAAFTLRLAGGEISVWATVGAVVVLSIFFAVFDRGEVQARVPAVDTFQLLPSAQLSLDRISTRPGGILVAVRHPHSLAHLAVALRTAGDRDVVAMTARLTEPTELDAEAAGDSRPTDAEAELFSQVIALAERYRKEVRLLIVPTDDVFDAVVAAVIRLQCSEVIVGESTSLASATQARLLGAAWERAEKPENLKVRLTIHHLTGRNDDYFLGAHAPTLTPQDVDLIHHLWLESAKVVGPHVHHHDVVRAALIQMAEQLNGPERDVALEAVRRVARQADELAAVVRSRDFSRLRDMVRNLPPDDLARLLTDLGIEDQVVVFRLLPRKDAAAAFEFLSQETQEALLKAMAQEDVASLLNEMSPDDRTMLLEELPATVTRQMLALLTPEERSVAARLLGYPEGSIGRLMTPDYIAVREDWTISQTLEYVRKHGQDSETLNVLYVVDDQGLLIDDVRIREVLLTSPDTRMASLMDRRFVALKATDDQDTAVAMFRSNARVALPVTDTSGMLIGIVTIDDVLNVAEEKATQEIQKIGGSEALDEPYMDIRFLRMLRKRAGWLTVLFLGEMMTASAMSWFGDDISRAVVLSFFIPLIISSGGNSGSQASTLVIRAMALGEVTLLDWWRVMRREIGVGLALGSILGVIGFLRITVWSQFSPIYGPHWLLVGLTVGATLIGIVLWGTLIGSLLPLLLRRLRFDPATSSAPFVATLVDVTGLVIYFSIASVILRGTLL